MVEQRPTLAAWLDEYKGIEADYLHHLRESGIDLAPANQHDFEVRRARERLAQSGACVRNGGASVCANALSSACVACTGDCGSKTFFLSLQCNRSCYFCFNANQVDRGRRGGFNEHWRRDVDAYFESIGGAHNATHVGLTGGEPLLHEQAAVEFVSYVHGKAPQAHIRLYTAGDYLTEDVLARLRDVGLTELRLSVKLDSLDTPEQSQSAIDSVASLVRLASRFIPQAMVEMPVIPGTGQAMRELLRRIDEAGAYGINLLEFGYPFHAWDEFACRGFQIKNPPFPVLYSWEYAGGLPVDGSELLALELMQFAIDEGLGLGVHYCSLENKNRDQVITQNRAYVANPAVYEQDAGDYFYKTLKVFDQDIERVKTALCDAGLGGACESGGDCLLVHPSCASFLAGLPVAVAQSSNIVEQRDDGIVLREVKLEYCGGNAMDESIWWRTAATAWEFAAFSLRYPQADLVEAVSSGEWADAAHEIAAARGFVLPPEFEGHARAARAQLVQGDGSVGLRSEATRLFIGTPHAACSPYEGVRRSLCSGTQPLLFVSRYAMEVERFCKACGFTRPENTNEPLDHVATECELLEALALAAAEGRVAGAVGDFPGDGASAAYAQFFGEHPKMWFKEFADALVCVTSHPFYKAVGAYLGALVENEEGAEAER